MRAKFLFIFMGLLPLVGCAGGPDVKPLVDSTLAMRELDQNLVSVVESWVKNGLIPDDKKAQVLDALDKHKSAYSRLSDETLLTLAKMGDMDWKDMLLKLIVEGKDLYEKWKEQNG